MLFLQLVQAAMSVTRSDIACEGIIRRCFDIQEYCHAPLPLHPTKVHLTMALPAKCHLTKSQQGYPCQEHPLSEHGSCLPGHQLSAEA